MCPDEGVSAGMRVVIYYSNTGESYAVANALAARLEWPLSSLWELPEGRYETAVLVFPVHAQGIPDAVRDLLPRLSVEHLAAVATYGRISPGNALFELQKHFGRALIVGAYVPTAHAYLPGDPRFVAVPELELLVQKILHPSPVRIPRRFKNPLATLFPGLRARVGVHLSKNERCTGCGECTVRCPHGGIENGHPTRRCIRCLGCVANCPEEALEFRLHPLLRLYLSGKRRDDWILYL